MKVSELMNRRVLTIGGSESGYDAVTRMVANKVRHLPVLADTGELEGIVTDRDLRHHFFAPGVFGNVGHISAQTLLKAFPVREIMSSPVTFVDPGSDLEDAARLMRKHRIGCLPVVEGGKVVGILTETDLLRHVVQADGGCSPEVDLIVVSYP